MPAAQQMLLSYAPPAAPPPGGGYRYWLWRVTGDNGGGGVTQASEFVLTSGGSDLSWPSGTTAVQQNAGYGSNGTASESPDKMIDGNILTKWCLVNQFFGVQFYLLIDCGAGNSLEPDGYRYVTGNDADERDPGDWTVEGSNDGVTWDVLGTVSGYDTGAALGWARNATTEIFPLSL